MKIKLEDLTKKIALAAQKYVSEDEAQYFAELLVDTHLKKTPRSNPLKSGLKDIENWAKFAQNSVDKTVDKPAITTFNFNSLAPALKAKTIHNELLAKARKNGIAAVAVTNSAGFHTLTFWTDILEKEGVIAFCMVNGGPATVVPFGAKGGAEQAVFGTNPISYSIPTKNTPISADMATSQIPFFQIVDAKKGKSDLPENAVVDSEGVPTNDVNKTLLEGEVANISPLAANHKGSALMLFFEVMTSALIGSPTSIDMTMEDFVPEEHGNLIVAFDIASFTDVNAFKVSSSKLAEKISQLKPRGDFDKVYYPGEGSYVRKNTHISQGEIEISDEINDLLNELQ